MINKAIILAAGFGIRLESITMHKPKMYGESLWKANFRIPA